MSSGMLTTDQFPRENEGLLGYQPRSLTVIKHIGYTTVEMEFQQQDLSLLLAANYRYY